MDETNESVISQAIPDIAPCATDYIHSFRHVGHIQLATSETDRLTDRQIHTQKAAAAIASFVSFLCPAELRTFSFICMNGP